MVHIKNAVQLTRLLLTLIDAYIEALIVQALDVLAHIRPEQLDSLK